MEDSNKKLKYSVWLLVGLLLVTWAVQAYINLALYGTSQATLKLALERSSSIVSGVNSNNNDVATMFKNTSDAVVTLVDGCKQINRNISALAADRDTLGRNVDSLSRNINTLNSNDMALEKRLAAVEVFLSTVR